MRDPFLIEGPAVISFSGGRTSGYMLWRILQAHGGGLPDDVRVLFANTGKEMPETLNFVQECSERWNVPIIWIEYSWTEDPTTRFKIVDYQTASRNGEPYEAIIDRFNTLPNVIARYCTDKMKITPMHMMCRSFGWKEWDACIGFRFDEPRRWAKLANQTSSKETKIAPLVEAKISVQDVGNFWKEQPFDLRLPNMNGRTMHGNCDLCFLKGSKQIISLIRENPARALWWIKQEDKKPQANGGGRFRNDMRSYKQMYDMALNQVEMFEYDEPLEDCSCTD